MTSHRLWNGPGSMNGSSPPRPVPRSLPVRRPIHFVLNAMLHTLPGASPDHGPA